MKVFALVILLVVAIASPSAFAVAHLVADLENNRGPNASSDFVAIESVGPRLVFTTLHTSGGDSLLWGSDGTAAGTMRLAPELTSIQMLRTFADRAVFFAQSRRGGGLWATDGTPAGTRRITPPGKGPGSPELVVSTSRQLWYVSGSATERTLWTSDGTPQGTGPRVNLGAREVIYLTAAGERIFFFAAEGLNTPICGGGPHCEDNDLLEWKLWVSDGTPAGTRPVRTLGTYLGLGVEIDPHALHAAGNTFFYVDFTRTPSGFAELWASDGTARGTVALGLFPSNSLAYGSTSIVRVGNRVAFAAPTAHGVELWVSDGTRAGTHAVTDLPGQNPFAPLNGSVLAAEAGRNLLVAVETPEHGFELWVTNGRPRSTRLLADLCPGPCSGLGSFDGHIRLGTTVFFSGTDGEGAASLFASDGTREGTRVVFRQAGGTSGGVGGLSILDGRLYFFAGSSDHGAELWQSDGTAGGTRQLSYLDSSRVKSSTGSLTLARLGERIFFPAFDAIHGRELWSADGRPGGTELVTDLTLGSGASSRPILLTALGDQTLFVACTADEVGLFATRGEAASTERLLTITNDCINFYGSLSFEPATITTSGTHAFIQLSGRLWVTDGTMQGTRQVQSEDPAFAGLNVREVVGIEGGIAFLARFDFDQVPPERSFLELWVSDGTAAGTRRLAPIFGSAIAGGLRAAGGRLFWAEVHSLGIPPTRTELHTADLATGAAEVLADLGDFPATTPSALTALGGRFYFVARDVIWESDGTAAGTGPLTTLLPDPCFQPTSSLRRFGDALLFFAVNFCTEEDSLWQTDGTPAGTRPLHTFPPRSTARPGDLVEFGDELVFTLDSFARSSTQFWATDGTPAGTRPTSDELPLTHLGLFAAGGRLYFIGQDVAHGLELWMSDGTTAGTRLVQDIHPGPAGSGFDFLAVTPTRLDFTADNGLTGLEVWSLPLTGPELCQSRPERLCLAEGRFAVESSFQGRGRQLATAQALPLTSATGAFSFWNPSLPDLVVKVLGARGDEHLFAAALSDAAFDLTITNTETGEARRIHNLLGQVASLEEAAP